MKYTRKSRLDPVVADSFGTGGAAGALLSHMQEGGAGVVEVELAHETVENIEREIHASAAYLGLYVETAIKRDPARVVWRAG